MSKQQDLNNDTSSSDNDDDDVLKALKEATDEQFLKESFFKNDNENGINNNNNDNENKKTKNDNKNIEGESSSFKTIKKSLRRSEKDDEFESDKFNDKFGVTKDFKKFVAKELAKSLDKLMNDDFYFDGIEVEKNFNKKNKNKVVDDPVIGIKLMSDSEERLTLEEIEKEEKSIDKTTKRKRKLDKGENFAELLFKCKNVAVQPESVLSKLDTKVWTEKRKGVIYRYKKLNDGTMIEIN